MPGKPFDFKRQNSLDLHIALGVDNDVFERMLQKGRARAIEVRGPVDHGFCRSIYFRDPERLHRRADRRHRRSPGDHGPNAVEAARGAHSLANREARLIRRCCPSTSGEPRLLRGIGRRPYHPPGGPLWTGQPTRPGNSAPLPMRRKRSSISRSLSGPDRPRTDLPAMRPAPRCRTAFEKVSGHDTSGLFRSL